MLFMLIINKLGCNKERTTKQISSSDSCSMDLELSKHEPDVRLSVGNRRRRTLGRGGAKETLGSKLGNQGTKGNPGIPKGTSGNHRVQRGTIRYIGEP